MTVSAVLDAAGRRRSPATMPRYHAGRAPGNKGQRYPADPPTVEEIIAVMRQTAHDRHGARLRALIVVLWRGVTFRPRGSGHYLAAASSEFAALKYATSRFRPSSA